MLAFFLIAGAGCFNSRAACGTNQTTVVDLSTWSHIQFGPYPNGQGPASWTVSAGNTVALQSVNADASIFLSPFILQNDQIEGSWRVNVRQDDDFMGFVFGYQDDRHFYLFDWKGADQSDPDWGFAERGMSVKVMTANSPLTRMDYGATTPPDATRARSLYHNLIPWADRTDYQFSLQFVPGRFTITVTRGATVLATIPINDSTYTSGKFGFYNFSQGSVEYTGFVRHLLAPIPVISVANRSVVEGNSGTTSLVFPVSLSLSNCEPTLVDYYITPGTATPGQDYSAVASGRITFAQGETNKLVTVTVFGDTLIEPNETLFITLTNPVSGSIGTTQAVGTIINDDSNHPPVCSVSPSGPFSVTPGVAVSFTVTGTDPDGSDQITLRSGALPAAAFVTPALPSSGPASGVSSTFSWTPDGTQIGTFPVTFTVTDGAGSQSQCSATITVQPVSDLAITKVASPSALASGGLITYSLGINNTGPSLAAAVTVTDTLPAGLTNVVFVPSQGSCSISGNIVTCALGALPVGANASISITARSSVQGTLINSASISGSSADPVSSNNTAVASVLVTNLPPTASITSPGANPCLLLPTNLTLIATASDSDGTVVRVEFFDGVTKLGESVVAPFSIVWTNVSPGSHQLTAIARDNSGAMVSSAPVSFTASFASVLSISDQAVIEGNTGTNIIFTITLSPPSCRPVGVFLSTANGTATAASDYSSATTVLNFAPGQTVQTFTVPIVGDTAVEADETFTVCLANASNATVSRSCATGTIINDDTNSDLQISKSVTPSTAIIGTTVTYVIDVVNHGPSANPGVVVSDMLPPGLSNIVVSSTRGQCDQSGNTVTCIIGNLASNSSATISITATVAVQGTLVNSATVSGQAPDFVPSNNSASATVTVLNVAPSVALVAPLADPCLTLPTNFTVVAAASDPDGNIVRVEFYNFATKLGERLAAPFSIVWSNVPPGAQLLTAVAYDNSGIAVTSAPVALTASFLSVLSVNDRSVVEGNSGTNIVFTITLAPASCRSVTVDFATFDGTALAGSDYSAVAGSVVFLPGETSKTVVVPVLGDTRVEPDETFVLCLSNAVRASLSRACGTGTIVNDDINLPPVVTITNPLSGAVFYSPPGIIPIEAEAHDSDGFVQRVDFYADNAWIGTSTNGPWTMTWTNLTPGPYTLIAIATDDGGGKGTSAPVNIVIRHCAPDLNATALTNQTRCLCDEVVFATTVSSSEPVSFVWKANGIVIPGETSRTLRLQGLKPSQAGTYSVDISTPCAATTRTATLVLKGAGNQNPVSFSNAAAINIPVSGAALLYPSTIFTECLPGPIKHITVTLDGLSHSSPDDIDVLLAGPGGQTLKLMSDCGGFASQKLTNVTISFSDTATVALPDATRIFAGTYRPTDYGAADPFPAPAPSTAPSANFTPFLSTDANGLWSLFIVDDTGGDSGSIARGWSIAIEWEETLPQLGAPVLLSDGRFQATLGGLRRMAHVIEASSDLAHWIPLSTNTPSSSSTIVFDLRPGLEPHRFYRAVRCP